MWQLMRVGRKRSNAKECILGAICVGHLVRLLEAHTSIGVTTCVGHLVGLLEAHTKGAATRIQST